MEATTLEYFFRIALSIIRLLALPSALLVAAIIILKKKNNRSVTFPICRSFEYRRDSDGNACGLSNFVAPAVFGFVATCFDPQLDWNTQLNGRVGFDGF